MKRVFTSRGISIGVLALLLSFGLRQAVADQVEMQNGDRFTGEVVLINSETLVLKSEYLGRINLPRSKVASLRMGAAAASNGAGAVLPTVPAVPHRPLTTTLTPLTTNSDLSAAFRNLGGTATTNMIEQIRGNLLSGASPEANQMFDQLMGGLMSGQINVDDIRQQAQAAADQIRALKRDGGNDQATAALDGYLDILDSFLKETAPPPAATNSVSRPTAAVQSKAAPR